MRRLSARPQKAHLHRVPPEAVLAAGVAAAGPDVAEIGADGPAEDLRIVGDDHRPRAEPRLEPAEIVQVFRLGGVDQDEVEASPPPRQHAPRLPGPDTPPPAEAR